MALLGLLFRNRDSGILFDGLENDGGPRRGDSRNRTDLLAKQLTQMLGVAGPHLQEVTVLAGDVMHLQNLGELGNGVRDRGLQDMLGGPNRDECEQRPVDRLGVD